MNEFPKVELHSKFSTSKSVSNNFLNWFLYKCFYTCYELDTAKHRKRTEMQLRIVNSGFKKMYSHFTSIIESFYPKIMVFSGLLFSQKRLKKTESWIPFCSLNSNITIFVVILIILVTLYLIKINNSFLKASHLSCNVSVLFQFRSCAPIAPQF